jgi:hypothetical protein
MNRERILLKITKLCPNLSEKMKSVLSILILNINVLDISGYGSINAFFIKNNKISIKLRGKIVALKKE